MEIKTCNKSSIQKIVDGINNYNLQQVAALAPTWTPLEFHMENEEKEIIGGVLGGIGYWNGLEIKILWVEENYRKEGIGSKLLKHIENIAKEKGATISMLDTFNFQAKDFYLKNGYQIFGEIDNFPEGHQRVYLSKKLNS
ncbi:GNAT family N-acetyltransferase [Aureivirga sp. CE67]|uniref:GNAT family N-acetyltransferase n=1 Tax=Aureivirga sp. CE67 TaxID=1788983 RepID=UPI0018CB0980|nr:GNAT family N-acetyltransferase [Aureivirga sp. CE67]